LYIIKICKYKYRNYTNPVTWDSAWWNRYVVDRIEPTSFRTIYLTPYTISDVVGTWTDASNQLYTITYETDKIVITKGTAVTKYNVSYGEYISSPNDDGVMSDAGKIVFYRGRVLNKVVI